MSNGGSKSGGYWWYSAVNNIRNATQWIPNNGNSVTLYYQPYIRTLQAHLDGVSDADIMGFYKSYSDGAYGTRSDKTAANYTPASLKSGTSMTTLAR